MLIWRIIFLFFYPCLLVKVHISLAHFFTVDKLLITQQVNIFWNAIFVERTVRLYTFSRRFSFLTLVLLLAVTTVFTIYDPRLALFIFFIRIVLVGNVNQKNGFKSMHSSINDWRPPCIPRLKPAYGVFMSYTYLVIQEHLPHTMVLSSRGGRPGCS